MGPLTPYQSPITQHPWLCPPTNTSVLMAAPSSESKTDNTTELPTVCTESTDITSGTYVCLQFYQGLETPDPTNTVYCHGHNSCMKRTNCMVDPLATCSEERFEISKTGKNKFIKVGDRVELRSLFRTSDWIHCTQEECQLEPCTIGGVCPQLEINRVNEGNSPRIQPCSCRSP